MHEWEKQVGSMLSDGENFAARGDVTGGSSPMAPAAHVPRLFAPGLEEPLTG